MVTTFLVLRAHRSALGMGCHFLDDGGPFTVGFDVEFLSDVLRLFQRAYVFAGVFAENSLCHDDARPNPGVVVRAKASLKSPPNVRWKAKSSSDAGSGGGNWSRHTGHEYGDRVANGKMPLVFLIVCFGERF